MKVLNKKIAANLIVLGALASGSELAFSACTMPGFPDHDALKTALATAVSQTAGGLDFPMWATVVDRNGKVCDVVFSGTNRHSVWKGSRVISAQKAYTGIAFSTTGPTGLALSSANLYSTVMEGGTLYGLQHSNPVDAKTAYAGDPATWGSATDPLIGKIIGGINVFGGGLALYDADKKLIGGIGVSGDTSCTDHNVAWNLRKAIGFDSVPAGVGTPGDNMKVDVNGETGGWQAFSHPECSVDETTVTNGLN